MKACAASPLSPDSHKNNFRIYCAGVQISSLPPQFPPAICLLTNICKQSQPDEKHSADPGSSPSTSAPPPPPPQKNHETRFSIIHKNLLNKQGSFLPTRSSSGSRTWSDLTWICFGCDATWPAYRAESCQIPRACWRSPAGPLKPRWDAWESSPSPPSTRW